jgi:hypothetical protein
MCYKAPGVTYFDILEKASQKGLDIIAFTDHNSVRGYSELLSEIRDLELLEHLDRLLPNEKQQLEHVRQLMRKVLVLPGFEFTATFGFHVLGIFSPQTSVRDLEHLLLDMGVPSAELDQGTGEVGATVDVLTAYRMIHDAGGIVIAAHANSSHGVALQGLGFGGQTKIAFTQDRNLDALEVTDLESTRHGRTAQFFDGSRPEYPRRMHCIQGSDAHRLDDDPNDRTQFGVGGRAIEVLLPERSFEALKEVFASSNFTRIRPYRAAKEPYDHVQAAREAGPSIVQSFHESAGRRGGRLHAILRDVVAFSNTNGGTIYVGVTSKASAPARGLDRPEETAATLRSEIQRRISPPVEVDISVVKTRGKPVLRLSVPSGPQKPYALEGSKIYIRQEAETSLAVREEIIHIISQGAKEGQSEEAQPTEQPSVTPAFRTPPPRTGVEVVSVGEDKGTRYFTLRDLRNGSLVQNVTKESARRLWRYAISEYEKNGKQQPPVRWQGELGLRRVYRSSRKTRYNLAQLDEAGAAHYYYGVTEEGLHDEWKALIEAEAKSESSLGSKEPKASEESQQE